ncbi:MAG: DUF6431 domain-containing protein [Symbiobacterium sp.]|jgi:hypothetical protein|nr:DUF6431 domain-containing protein [Symbiobacterium thermophilum]BAD41706.1 hypothetical protein STH2721 [Symbiobacterium thermophilum IAM 14863]
MCILLPLGQNVQTYLRKYGTCGPDLPLHCPGCGGRMRRHGRYWRWVFTAHQKAYIPIYRWWCPGCRKTCAILPDFLKPYARFITLVREAVVRGRVRRGLPWSTLARRLSSPTVSWLSEKTLRRWLVRARALAGEWSQYLAERVLRFWPDTDLDALTPRREGPDATLHFLLDVGDWYRRQMGRRPEEHGGVFAALNRLGEGTASL